MIELFQNLNAVHTGSVPDPWNFGMDPIRGSITNGSGSGSRSFCQWPSIGQQKNNFLLFSVFTFTSFFKDNKTFRSHKTVEIKVFLFFFVYWWKDPDLEHCMLDPDPLTYKNCQYTVHLRRQGSIFWSKTDIYFPPPPPPSEIYIFSPKKQRDFRATLPTTK